MKVLCLIRSTGFLAPIVEYRRSIKTLVVTASVVWSGTGGSCFPLESALNLQQEMISCFDCGGGLSFRLLSAVAGTIGTLPCLRHELRTSRTSGVFCVCVLSPEVRPLRRVPSSRKMLARMSSQKYILRTTHYGVVHVLVNTNRRRCALYPFSCWFS